VRCCLKAIDSQAKYPSGGGGFRVDNGTMMVDSIRIENEKLDKNAPSV
jgi:hypothetical protein